ncbi:hypothetical protein BCR44DRAFT_1434330 [Catenaria anguillulae PL171]|uniref:RNI-like protein n=1 Tax=Catenaria anguillulae PL171 TaxID=765915 RepID=A0A1Y2HLL6_9FUNG|nr:hypothetical protein BCR44DRAFT_1434330 [Catenaria anguillulae PL171]
MTSLDISGQGLKLDTQADVAHLLSQLAALPDLEHINLSGNTFGVAACQALGAALADKRRCAFLIPLPVEVLDLSDNAFGPAGANPLVPFLTQTRSLKELRLNNNGLGISGGTTIAKALIDQANAYSSDSPSPLRVFVAGRNRLENGSMPLLSQAFAAHAHLEHIQMPQNGIRPEGIATLVTSLTSSATLRVLDLQDNTFTKVGAKALANALAAWPRLEVLHLGDCLVGTKGTKLVMRALVKANVHLRKLHLGFNEMNGEAASEVAKYVTALGEKLELLELNGNVFDGEGEEAEEVKEALAKWGKDEGVLDELDEMEEPDSEAEEEEDESEAEEQQGEEEEELLEKMEKMGI